jgi:hypothetical protein
MRERAQTKKRETRRKGTDFSRIEKRKVKVKVKKKKLF